MHNVILEALLPREKILLPPLHIKLGLLKQFVKALDPNSAALHYIRKMFPHLSDVKVKRSIFTGSKIREMLAARDLEQTMIVVERNAWEAFRMVVTYFLGNNRCENYEEIVESLIQHYEVLRCRMSVKNMMNASTKTLKLSRKDTGTMGDYIWGMVRADELSHKRKSTSAVHF
jgi:hypothetical protein